MSVIGDSRRPDGAGPGILPLRHAGYNQQGISLDMRSCVLGIEIEKREERCVGMGFYSYTERSVGDLVGGMIWKLDMGQDEIRALPPHTDCLDRAFRSPSSISRVAPRC